MSNRKNTRKTSKTTSPNDLGAKAMLVRLRVNRWGAKKNDTQASRELAKQKDANPELVRVTKSLLDSEALTNYRKTYRKCRRIHKFYTLPWDEGVGLLAPKLYFTYTKEVGEGVREAEKYVREFVEEYRDQWNNGLSDYRKGMDEKGLGNMFDEDDYPPPDKVKAKFGILIRFRPIEDPNDLRVNLSADVSSDLKKQMHADFQDSLKDAMRDPIMRLHEVISHVKDKLKDREAIFRDSLIGNVQELVDIMGDLNVLNDPEITKIIKAADKEICSVQDVKALRTDPAYRKEVAKSADDILKQMKGYVS